MIDTRPHLSIIIPAFDEAAVIASTLRQLARYIADHRQAVGICEVIVVAAGSDQTAAIAERHADIFDFFQVVTPGKRAGKGRDVRAGFLAAHGDIQLFMDADLSTPLHHIASFVALVEQGAPVVIGVRKLTQIHKSFFRLLLSLGGNWLIRLVLFPRISDTQCGFKAFTAAAAQQLFTEQTINGWGFDLELLQHAKEQHYAITTVPITDWHEVREGDLRGQPLGGFGAALQTLRDLTYVRTNAWKRALKSVVKKT